MSQDYYVTGDQAIMQGLLIVHDEAHAACESSTTTVCLLQSEGNNLMPNMNANNMVTPVKKSPRREWSSNSNDDQQIEDFTKKIHFAVWPLNSIELFEDLLNQKPDEIHGRYGALQETLLHRYQNPISDIGEEQVAHSQLKPKYSLHNNWPVSCLRACRYGNKKVFDILLNRGSVLAARNKCGNTPLHLAANNARFDMIKVESRTRDTNLSLTLTDTHDFSVIRSLQLGVSPSTRRTILEIRPVKLNRVGPIIFFFSVFPSLFPSFLASQSSYGCNFMLASFSH